MKIDPAIADEVAARREQDRQNQSLCRQRARAGADRSWTNTDLVMTFLRAMNLDSGIDPRALKSNKRSREYKRASELKDARLETAMRRIIDGQGVITDTRNCEAGLVAVMLRDRLKRIDGRGD